MMLKRNHEGTKTRRTFRTGVSSCLRVFVVAFVLVSPGRTHGSGPTGRQPARPAENLRVGIATPDGGYAVTTMPLETYVARGLAREPARGSQPAARAPLG